MLRRLIGPEIESRLRLRTGPRAGHQADPSQIGKVVAEPCRQLQLARRDPKGGKVPCRSTTLSLGTRTPPSHSSKDTPVPPIALLTVTTTRRGNRRADAGPALRAFHFTTKEHGKATGLGLSSCKRNRQTERWVYHGVSEPGPRGELVHSHLPSCSVRPLLFAACWRSHDKRFQLRSSSCQFFVCLSINNRSL